jgi:hypothetical protein
MIRSAKGLIALDIDGTITVDMKPIPLKVIEFLCEIQAQGWDFVFITGRTFDFGHKVLKELPFKYYYAVQNGAILFDMPQQTIISKKYLNSSIFNVMDKITQGNPSDYVIYAGFEHRNDCYYRPKKFSEDLRSYLKKRCEAFHERWIEVDSFDKLPVEEFPSIKLFGEWDLANELAAGIEKQLNLHVPVIKDPFSSQMYVVQATHPEVSKGEVLKDLISKSCYQGHVIAAGDDLNDLSMFLEADLSIAMGGAPDMLKANAQVHASSAHEMGIIEGLKEAIDLLERKQN